jgi:Patatin-like phospholipase
LSRPLQWLLALFILAVLAVELWQNSVKWLFLCEVQWIALACLILLPILAWTIDRALVLGAYEIETWTDGFWLALLLAWAAASIIWTAQIELSLAETRLHEPIGSRIFPCAIGAIFLGLALLLNLVVTHLVSNAPRDDGKRELSWGAIDSGMLIGLIAGIVGFLIGEAVIWLVHLVLSSYLPPPLVEVVRAVQSWFQWLPPQLRDGYIGHSGNLATESSHVAAALLVVVTGVVYFVCRKQSLAPLCSLGLLLIALVWLLSGFAFFFQAFRIPTLLPLLVWLWLSARHPKADHFYTIYDKDGMAPSGLNFLEESGSERRILVVAAAGGGIQAAAWTAQVLAGLKIACDAAGAPNLFENSVRAVSGVSGGSVGLMYFLAAQARGISDATIVARTAAKSSLSEVTHALAYEDLLRAFCPFLISDIYSDRGKALEKAWIENASENSDYATELGTATLKTWTKATAERKLPAVIFNSTIVEEGQRLAFSTVPLSPNSVSEGFCEFTTLYPNHDISISTAARLSAAFTFVSPAARPAAPGRRKELRKVFSAPKDVQSNENLHLVDGGYLDNSGITALIELLRQKLIELRNRDTNKLDKLPRQILVLLINAFPLPQQQYVKAHRGTFFQLWAPLLTLFTVRGTAHDAMAQRELILFKEALRDVEIGWIDFRFGTAVRKSASEHTAKEPPPLSWHLTKAQKRAIIDAWAVMKPETSQVLDFLATGRMPIIAGTSRSN